MKVKTKIGKKTTISDEIIEDEIKAPEKSQLDSSESNEQMNRNDDDDNDVPEVVSGNSDDIKRLRELHEQMMLPAEKRTKKRKSKPITTTTISEVKKISADEELDVSVLAMLDGLNERETAIREGDHDGRTDAEDNNKFTRTLSKKKRKGIINIHARKSRKIGNIDVQVLDETEDLIAGYALPKSALSFAAALTTSRPRTSYSTFTAQRHIGPCSKFTANDGKLLPKKK